ncbi:hypothetical protein HPP92_019756 [Vanilla planifolia]|uniref:Uncharacterized protein n=1 Tax=Vanilla planifolia TaxID=51239 RepID=A0A835UL21_VANPL|nr:hypothetical protein HPP92_019756 [Vanilla planifolia]
MPQRSMIQKRFHRFREPVEMLKTQNAVNHLHLLRHRHHHSNQEKKQGCIVESVQGR